MNKVVEVKTRQSSVSNVEGTMVGNYSFLIG